MTLDELRRLREVAESAKREFSRYKVKGGRTDVPSDVRQRAVRAFAVWKDACAAYVEAILDNPKESS